MSLSKCTNCQWNYPSEILNSLVSSKGTVLNCCGICALEITNKILSVPRTRFYGEKAQECLEAAQRWRRKHPQHAPGTH